MARGRELPRAHRSLGGAGRIQEAGHDQHVSDTDSAIQRVIEVDVQTVVNGSLGSLALILMFFFLWWGPKWQIVIMMA